VAERPTVVIGGGLAGITAALRLADGGRDVVLLEARRRLGGAAFSFRRGELSIDNGQHVFLRCCLAYRGLLARLGAADQVTLQDALDIPVLTSDGRRGRLARTPHVPAPAHLTAALSRYALLSAGDRLRAVRGALALRRLDPADPSLDERTLGEFLRAHGQNDATIGALWGIVATATLNLDPDHASLALAAKVFRTGLLDQAPASDVGYAAVPLGQLHHTAAQKALAQAGVEVLLAHRVSGVDPVGDALLVRARDGAATDGREHLWRAEGVVIAVPHHDLLATAPPLAQTAAGAGVAKLRTTPIVNVHVVYDRPVTDLAFAAAVDSPVQWFFDRTHSSGLRETVPGGQYLAVTVSAADDLVDVPSNQIEQRYVAELARLLPAAGRARVLDSFVTRERNATFRQEAGSAGGRATVDSGIPGVWLAGAWTATGWPDTMESAVRSGTAAAEAALAVERTTWGAAA
jgi:squalene-associated FAD-dependent desaturase